MAKFKRNIWAKIGQLCALIAGIFLIIHGINLIIDKLELPFVGDVPSGTEGLDPIVAGIIAIVLGVLVIFVEIDKYVIGSHLVRGIVWIIVGVLVGGGLLLIIGGILYVLAEFLK
jgi:hypothetical protein